MSAVDDLFQQLREQNRKAFMPFITAGDPDLEFTAATLRELARRGCSMCELGIPYSDPIADGPVIQASYTRSLARKIKLREILDMLQAVTPELSMPIVTMVSYAIIYRYGLERYVAAAQEAGAAGAIVPDLPVDEAEQLANVCRQADFNLIQLVTPTTSRERALRIAESSSGFLYYVSVTGITGERDSLPPELLDSVGWLREQTELPICIGFGISRPEHIRQLAPVADGFIVGSAFVRRIAKADANTRDQILTDLGDFAGELLRAVDAVSERA